MELQVLLRDGSPYAEMTLPERTPRTLRPTSTRALRSAEDACNDTELLPSIDPHLLFGETPSNREGARRPLAQVN